MRREMVVQPRHGLGGRQILGPKVKSAHPVALLPSNEPHQSNPGELDLQLLDCAIINAVNLWKRNRATNGLGEITGRISKAEAARRLKRDLAALREGGEG